MMRHTVALAAMLAVGLTACSHGRADLSKPTTQDDFGVQMAKMNLWREAMFRFQRAVDLNPNDAQAHNNLAVAYEANGDYDKAAKEYREALKLDRTNQYIQKNYSRYTEFMARNKKRQQKEGKLASETKPGSSAGAATSAPPAAAAASASTPSTSAAAPASSVAAPGTAATAATPATTAAAPESKGSAPASAPATPGPDAANPPAASSNPPGSTTNPPTSATNPPAQNPPQNPPAKNPPATPPPTTTSNPPGASR